MLVLGWILAGSAPIPPSTPLAQINEAAPPPGVTLPMVLPPNLNQEDFNVDVDILRLLFRDLSHKEQNVNLARTKRNLVQEKIYPILRDYRLAVPATLGTNSPLTQTLPRLSPLPGKTPATPIAAGTYDEATS